MIFCNLILSAHNITDGAGQAMGGGVGRVGSANRFRTNG